MNQLAIGQPAKIGMFETTRKGALKRPYNPCSNQYQSTMVEAANIRETHGDQSARYSFRDHRLKSTSYLWDFQYYIYRIWYV